MTNVATKSDTRTRKTQTRHTWIMGNWKLNPASLHSAKQLAYELSQACSTNNTQNTPTVHMAVAPTFVHLQHVQQNLTSHISLMAQDISLHNQATGAFTGDVSGVLLKDIGVSHVLVGHSERRSYLQETAPILTKKIQAAHGAGINVVYCVGESLAERENEQHFSCIEQQLNEVLTPLLPQLNTTNLIIAYEPVWAIGTGRSAEVADIQHMHQHIRDVLATLNADFADISILYGGSVKPENAASIAACEQVDGALVGGAALNAAHFLDIANAFR